jgi:serine/threonine protein phosphatase PrpC
VRSILKRKDLSPWLTPVIFINDFSLKTTEAQDITLKSGTGQIRGRRMYMEDFEFSFSSVRINDCCEVSMFGVLDGHGGQDCARFACEEIPTKMVSLLRSGLPCDESLFKSIVQVDEEFLRISENKSGSCCNMLVWNHYSQICNVANVGDTRTVLCRLGMAVNITRDMKATDAEEIARIAQHGGFVTNGRVLGSLAVARAIGDGQLKEPQRRILISDPEITSFRFQSDDEFIIIATDGLWDVMSSQVYPIQ